MIFWELIVLKMIIVVPTAGLLNLSCESHSSAAVRHVHGAFRLVTPMVSRLSALHFACHLAFDVFGPVLHTQVFTAFLMFWLRYCRINPPGFLVWDYQIRIVCFVRCLDLLVVLGVLFSCNFLIFLSIIQDSNDSCQHRIQDDIHRVVRALNSTATHHTHVLSLYFSCCCFTDIYIYNTQ